MALSIQDIPPDRIPQHIAIIMDGNGRWAKKRGMPRIFGHKQGTENLRQILKACVNYGVKYLTIYAFSTENWGRPQDELNGLHQIFIDAFANEFEEMYKEGVRIIHIGQREGIPSDLMERIDYAVERSKANDRLILSIALNYGSRNEITNAVRQIVADKIPMEKINEQLISSYLYTAKTPDPDLVIRTSGEERLSNFLLWQSAYSEWIFPETLWPDFNADELLKAIDAYAKRDRRFGKVKK